MGQVSHKTQCPSCKDTGHDNLVNYTDGGGAYCFGCGYSEKSSGEEVRPKKTQDSKFLEGEPYDLPSRGISKATCKHYKYYLGKTREGTSVHIANYVDSYGNTVGQKLRAKNKKMFCIGDTSSTLFGQSNYNPTDKLFVTVTEGELDALSIAEVQGTRFPCVSVPNGAGGAYEALKKNLEWLMGFKHVVLAFDSDKAGQEAAIKCVDLFEPGKVRIATLPMKDASEMLVAGTGRDIVNCLFNAKDPTADSIVSVADVRKEAMVKATMGISWPWKALTDITYGIRPGAIYSIGAGSGIGKTEFIKDICLHLMLNQDTKVGVMSFEEDPAQSLRKMLGAMVHKRLHIPGVYYDEDEVNKAADALEDKVYYYDHKGRCGIADIEVKIRHFVKGLGCKAVVIDPFTAISAGFSDERKDIDKAMSTFGKLSTELGCTLILVSHLAKPMQGESYEEGRRVVPAAFRGSQSIQYWSSFMIGLERNKVSEDTSERNIMTVRVLKDRFTGEADGHTVKLKYNTVTGCLQDYVESYEGKII